MQKYCRKCEGITERGVKKGHCLPCAKAYGKQWRNSNQSKVQVFGRLWRQDNPEYQQKYRQDNIQKFREISRKKHKKNKEKRNKYSRQYYKDNSDRLKQLSNEWHASNPEKVKAHNAVSYAVKTKLLNPIHSQYCKDCDKQAQEYHHWSYLEENWLNVVPLCLSCHKLKHVD